MELTEHAAVFDRAAPTYDRVGVDFFATFGARLVALADLRAGESVLDVGCGRGAVLGPAADAVGAAWRAVGVDMAPTMVWLTAAELADHAHVEVRQGDATALPADLGTFDVVLSSLVLFFTPDPAATLRHWADHVAPGGRLGLTTFLADPDDDWFRDLVSSWLPEQPPAPADGPSSFELVRDPVWLDDALRAADLGSITAETLRHPIRFADVDQWWRWVWSHGGRAALEAIPADRHDAFKAAAGEALADRPLPDGTLGSHTTVRFTVARR